MANLKLSMYDRETISAWYEQGMYSQRELSEIYGVSRSTIRRVLEDNRNFCGRLDRPTFESVGQPTDLEVGLDDTGDDSTVEWTGPPAWLGVGLLAIALGGAGFIGWVIFNAAT